MKTRKVLLSVFLISNSLLLSAQLYPVNIDLRDNGYKLDAKFYQADKTNSPPTVILLHGFPGNSNSPYGLAEKLTNNGVNVLVFNYTGSFKSDGEKFKNKDVLFITAWLDTTVPMEEFIIPAYRHLKNINTELVTIKAFETDHFFTNKRDELANSISDWVKSK